MRVVITGGAGFIGRRLALRLLELNALTDSAGREQPVERIVLFDRAAPDPRLLQDPRVEAVIGDIGDPEQVRAVIAPDTGAVFHMAAVVSAGAEEDFRPRHDGQPPGHDECAGRRPEPAGARAHGLRELGRGLWRRDAGDDPRRTDS